MGPIAVLAALAAATPATNVTTVSLLAAAPIAADPVLAKAALRRPVVYIQAPAPALSHDARSYARPLLKVPARQADFAPAYERGPAEPAWSPVFSSMEIGRMSARRGGGNPLRRVFAFTVTDPNSEPSVGGLAGTLLKLSGSAR